MFNNLLTPDQMSLAIFGVAMLSVLSLVICTVTMVESLLTRTHNRKLKNKLRLIETMPVCVKGIVVKNEIKGEDLTTSLHKFLRTGYEHSYDVACNQDGYIRRYLVNKPLGWLVGIAEFHNKKLIGFRIEKGLSKEDKQYILSITGEQNDQ